SFDQDGEIRCLRQGAISLSRLEKVAGQKIKMDK
ncbi:MAG: hypothetical protein RIS51_339, partial [Actinomycetota bacterium]